MRKEFQSRLPKAKNYVSNYFFGPINGLQPKGKKSSRSSHLRSWNIWHFCLKNDLTKFFFDWIINYLTDCGRFINKKGGKQWRSTERLMWFDYILPCEHYLQSKERCMHDLTNCFWVHYDIICQCTGTVQVTVLTRQHRPITNQNLIPAWQWQLRRWLQSNRWSPPWCQQQQRGQP